MARVAIYDATGRMLQVLLDGATQAGAHKVSWVGSNSAGRPLPAGAYFVKLETSAGTQSLKITLVR